MTIELNLFAVAVYLACFGWFLLHALILWSSHLLHRQQTTELDESLQTVTKCILAGNRDRAIKVCNSIPEHLRVLPAVKRGWAQLLFVRDDARLDMLITEHTLLVEADYAKFDNSKHLWHETLNWTLAVGFSYFVVPYNVVLVTAGVVGVMMAFTAHARHQVASSKPAAIASLHHIAGLMLSLNKVAS